MLGSTKTREQKSPAKETTEGCWLKRTTEICGDRASHDRIARLCLAPTEPLNGLGAEKMVIRGFPRSPRLSFDTLIRSLREGNL